MIKRWFAFLSLMLTWFCDYGQAKDFPFASLDIQAGLSDNHVTAIFKDSRGYLWFGTWSGLNRYDGYSFKVFRKNDGDPASLTDDNIQRIFEGPEDKLYIATGTGGINIYDPLTERFVPGIDTFLQARHLSRYGLLKILQAKDQHYYFIYSNAGIFRYDPGKGGVRVL